MGKETVIIVRKFKNIFCFSFDQKKTWVADTPYFSGKIKGDLKVIFIKRSKRLNDI
ncbi:MULTISPECIES: hypothetical protein [Enterococcus]|uniref:hypothetical protein n=1 Tax=Enterococcus TaxID=1350 RepID=UPI0008807E6B|nr:hypothetical protein [Enterococcus casseliflavus]NKD29633.1 hypothetical protein [Enterococcus casseliflavus]SDK93965.1 hypothetical protein SAMN05216513_11737 [Enterococcus casseliflavus]